MGNFKEDIARTRAFVFDVDGVMTDGGIIPIDGEGTFCASSTPRTAMP